MKNKIYVGNLGPTSNEDCLREFFLPYGAIDEVEVVYDRETSRSRGFGYITFADTESAEKALESNGSTLEGHTLRVSLAQERQPA